METREDPTFSHHALMRARQRFKTLRGKPPEVIVEILTRVLLQGEVVFDAEGGDVRMVGRRLQWTEATGSVTVASYLDGRLVEFIIEPESGCVLTVVDPFEADRR